MNSAEKREKEREGFLKATTTIQSSQKIELIKTVHRGPFPFILSEIGFDHSQSKVVKKIRYLQEEWQLSPEQVAEFKEVFMLFDKDEDGVITFPEVIMVMKSLGQRPSGMKFMHVSNAHTSHSLLADEELLEMVRDVSEDKMYDTIEFNEFLQMMSKQQRKGLSQDTLKDAFR